MTHPDTGTAHCGRRLKDPWWTGITMETEIAICEGAKDAQKLREVLSS